MIIYPGIPGKFSDCNLFSNVGKGPKGDSVAVEEITGDGVYRLQFKNDRTGTVYATTPNLIVDGSGGGGDGGGTVSNTGKIYYVNNNITLDKTGDTDVTTTITNFINTVPEGSTLIFEKGTYKISTLEITKSLDVDFSGSTIVASGNYGITFSGTLKRETTLSQKFEPYQSHVRLASATGVSVGDLLVIYSDETLNPVRTYYKKAFTCMVSSVEDTSYGIGIDVKCPFDVPSGATVMVYKPISGSLKNIEKFVHRAMDPYHDIVRSVQLNQAYNFVIENVNCRQNVDYHIFVAESNHVIIQRCSIYVERIADDASNHMYFICIGGCSHTVTRDCHGVSNWHMWTTGGTTTENLFNLVEGCTHVSMRAGSFVDHPAALYTTIRDCQGTSAISVSAGGTIENTIVTEYKTEDSNYFKPRFTLQAWGTDYDFLTYNISNCKIVVNGDTVETSGNGAAINVVGTNGSGGTATNWYARAISIDGVLSNKPVYITVTPGTSVKQLAMNNCHNIMLASAENSADVVNLEMSNCAISGIPTLATFDHIYNNTITTILMGLGTNTTINNLQLSDIPSGYAYCLVANARERKLLINNLLNTTTQPLVITSTHNFLMVHLANCVGYLNAGSVLIDESLGANFPHLRIIGSVAYVIGNVTHDDAASTIITSLPS